MKQVGIIITLLILFCCTPKGPKTYSSPFVGKTKADLIAAKGIAKTIKVFDNAEAYIYKVKEEYFGNKTIIDDKNAPLKPKKTVITEHIYYINKEGIIYKYQVWKKKVN